VIVNYADDFVICCRPGKGAQACQAMARVMGKIGLTVNEQKTKVVKPGESFDFLGYTIGRFYGRDIASPVVTGQPIRPKVRR